MNISNPYTLSSNLHISLGATDELDIINSNIGKVKEKTRVSIMSGGTMLSDAKLNLVHSQIAGDKVECITNKMVSDSNSVITAKDKVDLSIDDFDKINVISPTIIFNGKEINSKDKIITLEKLTDPLMTQRSSLIDLLKNIKNQCEKTNMEKIIKCKNSLESKPISKVLKK